jgi:hypothetical protein
MIDRDVSEEHVMAALQGPDLRLWGTRIKSAAVEEIWLAVIRNIRVIRTTAVNGVVRVNSRDQSNLYRSRISSSRKVLEKNL